MNSLTVQCLPLKRHPKYTDIFLPPGFGLKCYVILYIFLFYRSSQFFNPFCNIYYFIVLTIQIFGYCIHQKIIKVSIG